MDRIKKLFDREPEYEPVQHDNIEDDDEDRALIGSELIPEEPPFSWTVYLVFMALGVAMLWAWNMYLAAAPYFQRRFRHNKWILNHFQPAEVSVTTATNLLTMIILGELQKNASYTKRVAAALLIGLTSFTLLALSTLVPASASVYFTFLLVTILATAVATALIQNGGFAYASGFGQPRYIQAIMVGQGIAGVLPSIAQIVSVAALPSGPSDTSDDAMTSSKSAFAYFLTAVAVSLVALTAFLLLLRNNQTHSTPSPRKTAHRDISNTDPLDDHTSSDHDTKTTVPFKRLLTKLPYFSSAIFLCFAITMVSPVFTTAIVSTSGISAPIFIPLAFLLWNLGDLIGRLVTALPQISLTHHPFALFCLAMARLLFIPLFFLCNIKGRGAVVHSDVFYLVVVQFAFGLSNGYLGSQCMMGAAEWVLPEEREATGGFMGTMLVSGLTVGSVLSFSIGGV